MFLEKDSHIAMIRHVIKPFRLKSSKLIARFTSSTGKGFLYQIRCKYHSEIDAYVEIIELFESRSKNRHYITFYKPFNAIQAIVDKRKATMLKKGYMFTIEWDPFRLKKMKQ